MDIIGVGFSILVLILFFWAINALSVLRVQMEEVIARLERIERAPHGEDVDRAV